MDVRKAKLERQLMEEIARLVLLELKDPRLEGIVITGVVISEDRSTARVYFTTLKEGKEEDAQRALDAAKGYIRSRLLKSLRLKKLPDLHFFFDRELKRMERIWERL